MKLQIYAQGKNDQEEKPNLKYRKKSIDTKGRDKSSNRTRVGIDKLNVFQRMLDKEG